MSGGPAQRPDPAAPLTQRVFAALADGAVHSGEALAATAGVTRSAVWKAIETLRADGLAIEAATNRGYRLAASCEALDAAALRAALSPQAAPRLRRLEVVWETGSTNADLLAAAAPPVGSWDALLAENQRGGRGRRGRVWRAALGDSLCVSLVTAFEPLPLTDSADVPDYGFVPEIAPEPFPAPVFDTLPEPEPEPEPVFESAAPDEEEGFVPLVADLADDAGLYDCLAAARELARAADTTEDRSRSALYAAVSRAYDFSLAAQAAPEDYAELIADAGLTVQDRAPMTPVVKLVFGHDYDKTRLTEYAAVLTHAHRLRLSRGALAGFLAETDGGVKAIVKAERRLRREEQGKPVEDAGAVREALAAQLRALEAITLEELDGAGPEFALVLIRRDEIGCAEILAELPEDVAQIERAARKIAG